MLAVPVSLYRDYRRLDDRRTRPAALADLRPDADRRGLRRTSRRQRLFTLLGFMGMYTRSRHSFLFLVWREIEHGPSARTAARVATTRQSANGNTLVLPGRRDARRLCRAGRLRSRRRASFTCSSRAPTTSAAPCSRRSARCGTATKSGCWPPAARSTSPSRRSTPPSFSGFYLPLMIVLWLLILRGISIDFGTMSNDFGSPSGMSSSRLERPARHLLRRGARQRRSRRALDQDRVLLPAALDEFSPAQIPASSIGTRCWSAVCASCAGRARRALGRSEDLRRTAVSRTHNRFETLPHSGGGGYFDQHRQLQCAASSPPEFLGAAMAMVFPLLAVTGLFSVQICLLSFLDLWAFLDRPFLLRDCFAVPRSGCSRCFFQPCRTQV